MKTTSYLRIFIASLTMTAIACSDPIEDSQLQGKTNGGTNVQTDHGEFHTSVTTWVRGNGGKFTGLVSQMPTADLSNVDVYVVRDGKRIWVYGQLSSSSAYETDDTQGEFFTATIKGNVLMLTYAGTTPASTPPFPLEVIIMY